MTIDTNAIRKLADAATPGPWAAGEPAEVDGQVELYDLPIHSPSTDAENPDTPDQVALIRYNAAGFQYPHGEATADAEFIAAARTLVPQLCDALDAARAENAGLTAANQRLLNHLHNTTPDLVTAQQRADQAEDRATDLANRLHRAEQEIASHNKAVTAWANQVEQLKADALEPEERQRAANAINAYIRLCGNRIDADHPYHAIARKLSGQKAEVA